jgi:general secretion pathway protein D
MIVLTNQPVQSNQVAGVAGILTAGNFQAALRSLQARAGVEELAEPEVVMRSGQQSQLRVTQEITVITNIAFQKNGDSAIAPQTEKVETGPTIDMIPYVLPDGDTINLTAIVSLTDFLGYVTPTNSAGERIDDAGHHLPSISPDIRIQQSVANVNLWDGQTLVMERTIPQGLRASDVPIIGDIPLVGHIFQSQTKTKPQKELIVFVTLTIVDPAGNRVHSEDELSFAKTGIPPQPPPSN